MKKLIKENKSFTVFSIVAIFMLIFGLVAGKGNELIFTIFGQYIILPIIGLIACICTCKKGGKFAVIAPVSVFAANLIIALAVYHKIDLVFIIVGLGVAVIGAVLGLLLGKIKKK